MFIWYISYTQTGTDDTGKGGFIFYKYDLRHPGCRDNVAVTLIFFFYKFWHHRGLGTDSDCGEPAGQDKKENPFCSNN